ncbi:MAG: hypothetical protein GY883_16945, partial [Shimia sp.]|nr:hypothetical protein [Shimia sp.]
MPSKSLRRTIQFSILTAVCFAAPLAAVAANSSTPKWLKKHIGNGQDQIAPVVLERARAHYLQKLQDGAVKNPCYFAMDATRPSTASNGAALPRFYVICENS